MYIPLPVAPYIWCVCSIWHYLDNLKNVKNTHWGVLLLVNLQAKATLLKVTLLYVYFLHFLNCTNGTKSRKASHIFWSYSPIFTKIRLAKSLRIRSFSGLYSVEYGTEILRLRTLFTQCCWSKKSLTAHWCLHKSSSFGTKSWMNLPWFLCQTKVVRKVSFHRRVSYAFYKTYT